VHASDCDDGRDGKAALARVAEGRVEDGGNRQFEVGVGHDHGVVFGPACRLNPLLVLRRLLVHVAGDGLAPDEADGPHTGLLKEAVHHLLAAMDDVQDPLRKAGLQEQLG